MHSTHFIYGYMASGIWLRTIQIARKETRYCHMGYYVRLAARVLLYASSHRQDNIYHSLCYTSRGALVGTRNSSMGPPHEGSIQRPIAPYNLIKPAFYYYMCTLKGKHVIMRFTYYYLFFYLLTLNFLIIFGCCCLLTN